MKLLTSRVLSKLNIIVYILALLVCTIIFNGNSFKKKFNKFSPQIITLNSSNNPSITITHARSLPEIKELHNARVDTGGIIKIFDWVWSGNKWSILDHKKSGVCFSTQVLQVQVFCTFSRILCMMCAYFQSSIDRIYWIPELVTNWNGPLSLAVFVTSFEEWIGLNLIVHHFTQCYQLFRNFVSIHVAIPTKVKNWSVLSKNNNESMTQFIQNFVNNNSCNTKPKIVVTQILEIFPANKELLINYPQNHLRNIAKLACGGSYPWVFSGDVDIIPAINSAARLQDFLTTQEAQSCTKYVIFVIFKKYL
jgi:hypothetical protein